MRFNFIESKSAKINDESFKERIYKSLGVHDAPGFIRVLELCQINIEDCFDIDSPIFKIKVNPLMPVDDANYMIASLREKLSQLSSQATITGRQFPLKFVRGNNICHVEINFVALTDSYRRAHQRNDFLGFSDMFQSLRVLRRHAQTQEKTGKAVGAPRETEPYARRIGQAVYTVPHLPGPSF